MRAKKRFGQNFLCSSQIISNIVAHLAPKAGDNLIEIGPGHGALTKPVFEQTKQLTVIEIDNDLIAALKLMALDEGALKVVHQDVLQVDFSAFGKKQRIFGNLPYNISTPLIFHLIDGIDYIDDLHFMLQKEVVDRLVAQPNTKAYGQLSVVVQSIFDVEKLFEVPKEAFVPAPQVTSAIVRLKPKKKKLDVPFNKFSKLAKMAFSKRRKTLNNNFRTFFDLSLLDELGIDGSRRAETLSVEEFAKLCRRVESFL